MTDSSSGYERFFAELKRRRVFRVMAVYGVVAFAIIEAADIMVPRMALPEWTVTFVVWVALFGFPIAIVLAWVFDLTPEGVKRTAEAAPGEIEAIVAAPARGQEVNSRRAEEVFSEFGGPKRATPPENGVTQGTLTPANSPMNDRLDFGIGRHRHRFSGHVGVAHGHAVMTSRSAG